MIFFYESISPPVSMIVDNLEFTPSVPNLDLKGTIFIPTRSSTMVECFAIDWIIYNLKLDRVGLFTSPSLISPLVQLNAFSDDMSGPLTTAVELFANEARTIFAIQIRSEILNKKQFASQMGKFVTPFDKVIILTGSDSCFLSGHDLEKPQIRWDCDSVVNGGLVKYLESEIEESKIVVASTRGKGIGEVVSVAQELAKACMVEIGQGPESISVAPPSVRLVV